MGNQEKNHLKKSLDMMAMVAIAAGSVIGGWLAESPYWYSLTGPGAAFIFLALAILLIPVGLAFAEMVALLPFSSSVAVWTANATNHKFAWCIQWLMFLIQIVEPPICAFILTTALGYFITFSTTEVMLIAIAICVLWFILSNFNISVSGKISTIFFYAMITISIIIIILFFTNENWSTQNLLGNGGWFPKGGYGVFLASGVLTIKYIGFEMTPTMIEELNKYGQPYISNIFVLGFTIFFCIFSATNWVQYIYAVSCIAAGLVYFMVCYDAYRLRKIHPEWERPYRAPGGNGLLFLGMAVSIWVVIASSLSLDFSGWLSLIVYMLIGIVILIAVEGYRKKNPGKLDAIILTPDNAHPEE